MTKLPIVLVDDHKVIREGLRMVPCKRFGRGAGNAGIVGEHDGRPSKTPRRIHKRRPRCEGTSHYASQPIAAFGVFGNEGGP